jgi:hypothetical protein
MLTRVMDRANNSPDPRQSAQRQRWQLGRKIAPNEFLNLTPRFVATERSGHVDSMIPQGLHI